MHSFASVLSNLQGNCLSNGLRGSIGKLAKYSASLLIYETPSLSTKLTKVNLASCVDSGVAT